jgi:predicted O-methyltransferase YrrM
MSFLRDKGASVLNHFRRRVVDGLINCHLRALGLFYKERPVPLKYWQFFYLPFAILSGCSDPLFPNEDRLRTSGKSLSIRPLKELLRHDLLGEWSLDADTITFLWQAIREDRPKIIIECGAGVSTLLLAKGLADNRFRTKNVASLLSLEQDVRVKEAVEKRLEACGLKQYVTILHAPISKRGDYQFDANELRKHLGSQEVDWLIIDGPAGPEGCRVSTLPFLARFCRPGARWFLDDAFRDGELKLLNHWDCLPGIEVEGIYPIGKGLGAGVVKDPEQFEGIHDMERRAIVMNRTEFQQTNPPDNALI